MHWALVGQHLIYEIVVALDIEKKVHFCSTAGVQLQGHLTVKGKVCPTISSHLVVQVGGNNKARTQRQLPVELKKTAERRIPA